MRDAPPPTGPSQLYQGGLYRREQARPAWPPPAANASAPPPRSQPIGQPIAIGAPPPQSIYVQPPRVVVRAPRDHHVLMHALLTLFTCGLWLPVWLVIEFGGTIWAAVRRLFR